VVDDDALVRRGLAHLLATCVEGAEVTEAGSADEAVEILASEPHDVALVDIRMPGRDGLELLREIRSFWPALPVIMLSSHDNGEYFKAALAETAAGFLLKDATPEDLAQAIHVALSDGGKVLSRPTGRRGRARRRERLGARVHRHPQAPRLVVMSGRSPQEITAAAKSAEGERQAIARADCQARGHLFQEFLVVHVLAPQLVACTRCGSIWRIHPQDRECDFSP
jgi:DNA-binding NarL/FixJ family response regulator